MHPASLPTLVLLQFFFTLSWTVYVLFLPQLAEQAGIGKGMVVALLMLDQAIFAVMDWMLGAYADRAATHIRRLGLWMAGLTVLSTLTFLLLPFTALAGSAGLMAAAIVVWSVTSSVLRAPPLVLLARQTDFSRQPRLAAAFMFGLGLAGAASPYLTLTLRGVDPRLPFALCAVAVIATTLLLVRLPVTAPASTAAPRQSATSPVTLFLAAALLLGIGFQIHFALNAAPRYLTVAKAEQLPWLMPLFWVSFNLAVFPVLKALENATALGVMMAGAVIAAIGATIAAIAGSLELLIAAELVAGVGWACVTIGMITAALHLGSTGREGFVAGGAFAFFAVAVFLRLGLVLSGVKLDPGTRYALQMGAVAAWAAAGLLLFAAARRVGERATEA